MQTEGGIVAEALGRPAGAAGCGRALVTIARTVGTR
jgi:hypothetical protein